MSNYPRRSARISSHSQQEPLQQRSANLSAPVLANNLSQPSSTSTSSHPSPISDALNPPPPPPTPQQPQPHLQIQSHFMSHQPQQQAHLHAPLPSPSTADMEPFFGRPHSQPNPYTAQQMHLGYPAQRRQQQPFAEQPQINQDMQKHQLHPHTNSIAEGHPAHTHPLNPGQLPPDFLAEAAKRAQMACLMRDFGDVSL
ncbi:uncharacterized protein Z518_07618 [Rhinocladiella mackenziei CBS 650.93]|uniref:Uncharacterized protein n=1 Tax=Rhinocladiella mackenziei CBS 650.93 TaxID=1442369 RepID=A0A0D2J4Z9_9EURO|nr:uncharacterized protein Z518_07618 [Rhinocladiella mackenziei CBS 650.93]KIX04065.1 hypothetical protein Z518_07618 [Rhinocladiella mackenziei CBS 650.93]